jgi:hypothetical protein
LTTGLYRPGAARIFGELLGEARAASLRLPSVLPIQTKRAGQQFPEVGPNFIRSYSSRSCPFGHWPFGPAIAGAGCAEQLIKVQIVELFGEASLCREDLLQKIREHLPLAVVELKSRI